ncbi:peptidyl-tRNA hydrolase 2, mitochondrial-like [Paramacrobiotus metropolitanus]|uniref:peptidyl-tRNA hydrolase 2, mitochondrial-like n=1 Tax=Paramacrobiotus metropolitanus TaxID=2943436 RepID=UPI0024458DEE|nr:peptidyl-tRNA hydrolase 2, mitochondrial-like [Paramacrobiotus metropolitanus]
MPQWTLSSGHTEVHLGIFIGGLVGGAFLGWLVRGRQAAFMPKVRDPKTKVLPNPSILGKRGTTSPLIMEEWTDTSEGETDENTDRPSHSRPRTRSKAVQRDCKMVFLVRMDLEMGKGKMAAQCAHAALGAYEEAIHRKDIHLRSWKRSGQAKIALKVPDETTLITLAQNAKNSGLNTYVVRDAGRTQIAAGSVTVCAIGPGEVTAIDKITGHLKLL